MNKEKSVQLITEKPKSFIRTGDGELRLIMGENQPFQKYDSELACILCKVLENKDERLYVGVNRNYYIPLRGRDDVEFYVRNAYDYRRIYEKYCTAGSMYIDSTFTSLDFDDMGTIESDEYFRMIKYLFDKKKICLICGEGIMKKIKHNVFEDVDDFVLLEAPRINAWEQKDEIIQRVKQNIDSSYILVFVLGMAGKAINYILTQEGYMCWDVGHLVKYYDLNFSRRKLSEVERKRFFSPD